MSQLVFHIGEHATHWAAEFGPAYTFQPTAPQQRHKEAGRPLLAAAMRPAAAAEVLERPTPRSLGAALWSREESPSIAQGCPLVHLAAGMRREERLLH